jgi:undecaprenyl phosphate N,N'-diacetylbacillosamine 1-phosphate transferase
MKLQLLIKRCLDLIVSLFLIVFLIPIWLIVGMIIKIDSIGPVLFIQKRPGKGTEIINVYKFRTMRQNSEIMLKGKEVMLDDDRITKVGKFLRRYKIDEIPQLINVLKGEMSLIGPRPERIESLSDYNTEELKRFNMRPGMTGLAQVNGNIFISLKERYQYDVYYVENFNIFLDLVILFKTIGVVIMGERKFIRSQK